MVYNIVWPHLYATFSLQNYNYIKKLKKLQKVHFFNECNKFCYNKVSFVFYIETCYIYEK